jgi:flagellar M-ring protein FliF
MDLFNKAFSQLGDLLRSMTPGGRLTAGLLLVVVVVSLGYLFQHQMSGPDVFLMNGEPISPSCLPAMEAAFAKANLSSYTVEGARIRVPRGQQGAYMAALADAKALPPNFSSALRGALDAGSPFESPKQRELRFNIAVQEELSRIIRQMTGIEDASVLIDSQRQPGLSQEKLVTASISVKPQGSEPLDPSRVSAIRGLVAGAIAGLKPDNVIVADLNTGRVFHGDPRQGGEGSDNLYLAIKEAHERALKAKLLSALGYIPNLTVEPTIELDHERSSRSQSLKLDPKTVSLRSTEKTTTRTRDGTSGGGGRPGFQASANAPTTLASSPAGKGSREEEENSASGQESEPILREHIEKDTVGFTPKRATVAVGIPSSYFEKVWHERNPAKEGEEPKTPDSAALDAVREEVLGQVRKHVVTLLTPLLPPDTAQNMADLVTITTFQDIKPGALPGPSTMQKVLAWLGQHWSTLGLIGLVGAGLLMLRSMVRGVPPPEPSTVSLRIAATPEVQSEPGETAEIVAAKRLRRLVGGGPNLRDELSELVKEDPDAAANILRTWIGQAG